MIDEAHIPWLIEINKFPTLEHSTHVTSNLVPRLMRDMCKLIIDGVDKQPEVTECGDFELIHSGEYVMERNGPACGSTKGFEVVGTRITK